MVVNMDMSHVRHDVYCKHWHEYAYTLHFMQIPVSLYTCVYLVLPLCNCCARSSLVLYIAVCAQSCIAMHLVNVKYYCTLYLHGIH